MKKTTLQSLIKKQKKRIPTLQQTQVGYDYPDMLAYYTWVQISKRFLRLHFSGDESVVDFCKLSEETLSRCQQEKLLAILNAFVAFPITIKNDVQMKNKEKANFVVNVTNNNSQSRNQNNRKQTVNAENYNGLVKPRSGIMAKLKTVCVTVVIGVLVDLLSDLTFWQWLHNQLELIIGCISL